MTIANALKKFFLALNGQEPSGGNVADVVKNGTASVQRNNESALANRMNTVETTISSLNSGILQTDQEYDRRLDVLESNCLRFKNYDVESFVLKSSTNDSAKRFTIMVADDGTITATELNSYTATWDIADGITTHLFRDGVEIELTDLVFNGDELTFFATPPEGRTFTPIEATGMTYTGAPSSADGMVFTVNTDFTVTLGLAAVT